MRLVLSSVASPGMAVPGPPPESADPQQAVLHLPRRGQGQVVRLRCDSVSSPVLCVGRFGLCGGCCPSRCWPFGNHAAATSSVPKEAKARDAVRQAGSRERRERRDGQLALSLAWFSAHTQSEFYRVRLSRSLCRKRMSAVPHRRHNITWQYHICKRDCLVSC